jgi:hypothetical protein
VLTFDSVPWCVRSMSVPVLLVQTSGKFGVGKRFESSLESLMQGWRSSAGRASDL